ncbi:MAG: hypothetical protein V2I31_04760 [Mariniphaga sp.]|jgi:hypothetical protein|nr:hypothetical protein [Mariniphaga sp.]
MTFYWQIFTFIFLFACHMQPPNVSVNEAGTGNTIEEDFEILNDTLIELTELQRGDILVKPNHNWFPGSAWVEGGVSFGHIALVVEGATGSSADEVLQKAVIIESQARDIPEHYQLRKVNAYRPGFDYRFDNFSFDPSKAPYRYRLRPELNAQQIDSLIAFMESHLDGISCWRAQKKYTTHYPPATGQNKSYWYCSLLIWQAFHTVLGIDIDVNQGVIVYPNDVIWCSLFENDSINKPKRVRF